MTSGLESIFKLSLIMNLIDNLSGPMAGVQATVDGSISKLEGLNRTFGDMAKTGAVMQEMGTRIVGAVLSPVQATFETKRALGELRAMGVRDLATLESAARSFSDEWAGTTKSEFLTAAIDIKGGIDSLSEEGIARYTELSGITAKATGSTIGEMTSLFATGYGIYKDYYDDLSDIQFGEMFSAGLAQAILTFKASGSSMAQSITALGGSATTANVPLEEQLGILGMLQATMSGSEAGTKYRAFLREAAKAGKELGLSFVDANDQLRSMPEILGILKSKYGETLDAVEKQQIQEAFGSDMAVGLIDLLYNKTDALQDNILTLYDSMGSGVTVATEMATAINETEPERYERLTQRIGNVKESIGQSLLPVVNDLMDKGEQVLTKVGAWIDKNQDLVRIIMTVVLAIGGFLAVGGTVIAVVGGVGLIITKTIGAFKAIKAGFLLAKVALSPLKSTVWSFTAALLANPITWIVIGIVALVAAFVILWNKCEGFRNFWIGLWNGIKGAAAAVANWFTTAWTNVVNVFTSIWQGVTGIWTSITDAFTSAWNGISDFFSGLWSGIVDIFKGAINWIIDGINGIIGGINKVSNSGLAQTLGIAFEIPKIPRLAEGGIVQRRPGGIIANIGEGLYDEAVIPLKPGRLPWDDETNGREPVKKVNLTATQEDTETTATTGRAAETSEGVFIEKLLLSIDFSKIKELPMLLKLLKELEDYTNANGGSVDANAVPEPA